MDGSPDEGNRPVEPCALQQARHNAGRLPRRIVLEPRAHKVDLAEEILDRQARLNRGVRESLLTTTLARRRRGPGHTGIEPDRQRPALAQRYIAGRPVQGAVAGGRRPGQDAQLCRWTPNLNPSQTSRNKAVLPAYRTEERAVSIATVR